ncbi:hypothetical protein QBC40DRAFT_330346 [Triangularia verruculosa]|uniref:Uncharacterized protein n=1 Tax=Triangularia verruculosa TaxID=2587418 RepID=A0AAN6XE11_9PEZI|nr:hypothetical protein QBC40DRAFT_330346 [Triangularia verruculosa]
MMIAAGELDRLSFLADDMAKSKKKNEQATATHSEQSPGNETLSPRSVTSPVSSVPPNTPNTATGGVTPASPMFGNDVGLSRSVLSLSGGQGDFVPFPPANTPTFTSSGTSSPIAGTVTPSRSGAGLLGTSPGKQRAAGPSKLSEVYNFEEAARRLSRSDSLTPRPQEKEEEPIYHLESFPEFPDRGDTSSVYTSGESTPRHRPGAHYFVATDLATGGVSGLKPKGHTDCEQLEGRRLEGGVGKEQGEETHAVDCKPDTWAPENGEPGDGEPFCPRDSRGSRLSFATAAERRKSWLDIARRATKGRWDHELEERKALTSVEGEATGNEQVVTKRKHTIADIVELLKMGKATQKDSE